MTNEDLERINEQIENLEQIEDIVVIYKGATNRDIMKTIAHVDDLNKLHLTSQWLDSTYTRKGNV